MYKALEGFLGRIMLVLRVFPDSVSSATTEESLVAATKTFFSKPCKLQVTDCKEIIPVLSSLAKCLSYNKVGPSRLIRQTCIRR